MRGMFEHAGKHLHQVAHDALDIELYPNKNRTVRDALGDDAISVVTVVERDDVGDTGYHVCENTSFWSYIDTRADEAFDEYMEQLCPEERFALAVRLWCRVCTVNEHDIVDIIRMHDEYSRPTVLNGMKYSLADLFSRPALEVDLPAHVCAHALVLAYPEHALVPCAVAAGMTPADAADFVHHMRVPPHRIKKRSPDGSSWMWIDGRKWPRV